MKEILKKTLPVNMVNHISVVKTYFRLRKETILQMKRFARSYAKRTSCKKEHIETHIIFLTHQIEKGLSHRNFRYGFGMKVIKQLAVLLPKLRQIDEEYSDNEVYRMAIAALHHYKTKHEDEHFDLSNVQSCFDEQTWHDISKEDSNYGGVLTIEAKDKTKNASLTFPKLMENRHSIREFADEQVTAEEIIPAIEMAMRTPSVCNRQPTRVRIITDQAILPKVMKLQGGMNGYPIPPAMILVTADNQAFMDSIERNEGFVDGGLFSMSLLLALESIGLAACPLNTRMTIDRENETRHLLGVPDNEFLVMYIAVGHFSEKILAPISYRFKAKDIISII